MLACILLLLCIMYDLLPTWYIMICQFNIQHGSCNIGTIEQYVTIKLFIISPTCERFIVIERRPHLHTKKICRVREELLV